MKTHMQWLADGISELLQTPTGKTEIMNRIIFVTTVPAAAFLLFGRPIWAIGYAVASVVVNCTLVALTAWYMGQRQDDEEDEDDYDLDGYVGDIEFVCDWCGHEHLDWEDPEIHEVYLDVNIDRKHSVNTGWVRFRELEDVVEAAEVGEEITGPDLAEFYGKPDKVVTVGQEMYPVPFMQGAAKALGEKRMSSGGVRNTRSSEIRFRIDTEVQVQTPSPDMKICGTCYRSFEGGPGVEETKEKEAV